MTEGKDQNKKEQIASNVQNDAGAIGRVMARLSLMSNGMAHAGGFYDEPRSQIHELGLIHEEVSEMTWAVRHGNPESKKLTGYSNLEEEAADVFIRLADFCGEHRLRLGPAIVAKMLHNAGRPYKHGKEF